MTNKKKLELTWIGKQKRPRLEPRIFLEDSELSFQGEKKEGIFNDNLLIHGDNLLALKALEQDYFGKIKCIFIDPPYNTGSAFSHYDDGLEHSMWLSLIRDRLLILQSLLSIEGSIWITIDDAEGHYLKVLCDEIFGRSNFIGQVTWQKTTSIHNNAILFSSNTDMVLAYAKNIDFFSMGRIPRSERNTQDYKNQDDDPRGPWASSPLHVSLTSGQRGKQYAITGKSTGLYPIVGPNGQEVYPPKGRCWAYSPETIKDFESQNLIWWGKDGNNQPRLKRFIKDNKEGVVPSTLWLSEDVGHNQEAKAENNTLLPDLDKLFSTPKPERLLERVIRLSTKPGDIVLDSFAGSGTTGAVAHKMGRRWIMVELGDHCETHIVPRLKKVIDGEDQGGISKAVNWQGGGGFRYLRLAPSLLQKDEWGNWIINKEYNAEMLSAAMCKHMGFTYAPSETQFWNHGYSTETDFIYVTTGSLAYDQLKRISEDVGEDRTLLICCKAFMSEGADFPNLTIKKIPQSILNKCEWDNDDYSFTLNVLAEDDVELYDDEEEA
ncbi:site-specific DNA-methyltransferase [Proteus terrae]|uniref:site-specific DNA-methyltransferase n=1 Tax=Proteus terrae TaxID=1574161 RepID=UPI0013E025BA|nr:site-specific DNA-methyltransferase [Proteus terrae]QIF99288.1 site-specific DNA-methyltransferase [Proteus terrae subsp. cibarius]UWJ08320.1 site-specific DNA-methyltransferase [Proteus mirabilis]